MNRMYHTLLQISMVTAPGASHLTLPLEVLEPILVPPGTASPSPPAPMTPLNSPSYNRVGPSPLSYYAPRKGHLIRDTHFLQCLMRSDSLLVWHVTQDQEGAIPGDIHLVLNQMVNQMPPVHHLIHNNNNNNNNNNDNNNNSVIKKAWSPEVQ